MTAAIISAASVATSPALILLAMGTTIPDPAIPATTAVPVTLAEAMPEEAATAVAEETAVVAAAIDEMAGRPRAAFGAAARRVFRLIPVWIDASLESLETAVFPFASGRGLKYLMVSASPMGLPIS
jgi:hypothetical protein